MAALPELIQELRARFLRELQEIGHSKDLENLKLKFLGKKGPVQALMIELKDCPAVERPHLGKLINDLKEELLLHCERGLKRLQQDELNQKLASEWVDVSLPGRRLFQGRMHPIRQMLVRAIDLLVEMGFSVQLGPNVDTDYYNFEALNFPKDHPAREMQDTFYLCSAFSESGCNISGDHLLRTHTSNVQVRTLERHSPPIRVIAPGAVFRNEDISARSHVFFHQIEGFYIDCNVTFADLLATMNEFLAKLLGETVETRFRPSYFPFVEPGLEVDVRCISCKGAGCRVCKHTGWLEILGAGMIHPEVLKKGDLDPDVYSGFAWGMGIERLAIVQYGIPDIRLFSENDFRFLAQFP